MIPKLFTLNDVNTFMYQYCLEELEDSIFMEQGLIVRDRPIGSVLKLSKSSNRRDGRFSTRELFVNFKLDTSALLIILPCKAHLYIPEFTVVPGVGKKPTDDALFQLLC